MKQNADAVPGTWKLRSCEREETHDRPPEIDAISIPGDRVAPRDLAPGVPLPGSTVAYAGTYAPGGQQVTHHIDLSRNQGWTGSDQVRFFESDGITTAQYRSCLERRERRSIRVWDKVQWP